MIYVRDLLKLDTFKDFELVSGENGLDRGVSWPNVAQTVSIREWLVGGDVILMSGVGLKITDEFLTDIVVQAADGRAACIIMLINPEHIASIPQAAIDEAVKRGLAVFAAPWETKLSRVIGSVSMLVSNDRLEERMHSEFLDRLLSGEIMTIRHIANLWKNMDCLEKKPWQLLIINLMKNINRQRIRHIIMTVLCGK